MPARVITSVPTADRAKATVKIRIAIDTRAARSVPDMGVRVSFMDDAATSAASAPTVAGVGVPPAAVATDGDRKVL